MRRGYSWLLTGVIGSFTCGMGCTHSGQDSTSTPLSTADKQKMTEMSRQAQINVMSDRINHSNLSPEQKQHLLEQVHAGAGK